MKNKITWEFQDGAQPQGSSGGFWYDITDGGYIDPAKMLASDEQIQQVEDAVALLKNFRLSMMKKELLIEF